MRLEPDRRRRRGRGARPPTTSRRPRPADRLDVGRRRRGQRPSTARADLSAMLLGYDLDPRDEGSTLAGYLAARDELAAAGQRRRSPTRSTLLDGVRRLRRAEPQPAGRRGGARREPRAQPARALPHLPADPRPRAGRAARASSAASSRRCCATTASTASTAPPSSRRRSSGSSSPSSARRPTSSLATSLLQRWMVEPAPRPPLDAAARERARPARRRHPAALPRRRRPRPQRAVPLVRPAARRRRPRQRARRRCATSSPRWPAMPDGDGPRRAASTRSPRSPSRSSGSSPSGSSTACPQREPMLEVLIKRHYREYELHRPARARRRRPAVRGRRLHARRTGRPTWSSTIGRVDELTPGSGLDAAVAGPGRRARPRATEAVVDLYLSWPDEPESTRRRRPPRLGRAARRGMPFARRRAPRRHRASCPAASAPVGYFTFRPDGDGAMVEDRLVRGVHPMVGRRLNLWRLRDFERHPARGPRGRAALPLRRAGQPGRPAPRGAGPGAPARRRPRRGRAGSPRCRTSSAPSPTASRRSAGRARPAAPPAPGST